mmetsp:Transcript_5098/g.14286  ORF Transcript_5098/g.14286 Transcript_5098/m.14286 type:complete len:244 (+) Transcript_5098:322-1053(+)
MPRPCTLRLYGRLKAYAGVRRPRWYRFRSWRMILAPWTCSASTPASPLGAAASMTTGGPARTGLWASSTSDLVTCSKPCPRTSDPAWGHLYPTPTRSAPSGFGTSRPSSGRRSPRIWQTRADVLLSPSEKRPGPIALTRLTLATPDEKLRWPRPSLPRRFHHRRPPRLLPHLPLPPEMMYSLICTICMDLIETSSVTKCARDYTYLHPLRVRTRYVLVDYAKRVIIVPNEEFKPCWILPSYLV